MANNTPDVRFEGFSGEWEERKLGELGKVTTGKAFSSKDFDKNGEYLVITNKDISNSTRSQNTITDKINSNNVDLINKYKLNGENILVTMDGVNLGKTAKFSNEKALLAQRVGRIQSNNLDFIFQLTSSLDFLSKMRKLSVGNAIKHISLKQISDYTVYSPTKSEEQTQIGSFFKQLDDTIALQQQELDTLKQTKQGFLQKMFPKEGETVPELRFPGFSGEWEKLIFSECFDFPVSTNSLSRAMLNYEEGEIKSVHYGDILVNYSSILDIKKDRIPYITDGVLEKYKSNLLENGDLVFADAAEDATVGKAVEVYGIIDENLVAGLHTIVARSKVKKAEYFLGYYINSNIYQRQLLRLMQGSKVSAISKGNLQTTVVSFPNNIEEQSQIGLFFKQLDDNIALHQQELDAMKETKKAFLQKMFV